MAVNQVNLADGEELINLTEDTVSEDTLLENVTAHDASGKQITGKVVVTPVDSELSTESENAIQNKAVAEAIDVLFKNRSIFTDANTCTTMGTHYCATGTANVPFDCYGMMLVYTKDDDAWFIQEFYAIEDPSIHYVRTWVNDAFSDWVKVNDGGNADTVDGLHAKSFFQEIGSISSGSIKDYAVNLVGSGAVFVGNAVTDMPLDNTYWFAIINKCNTNHILMEVTNIGSNKKYICSYNAGTTPPKWYDWSFVGDGGNAATVNGLTVQTTVPANAKFTDTTYGVATTSANGLMSTGAQTFAGAKTFNGIVKVAGATAAGTSQVRNIAAGTAAATTANCPNGALYGQYS